MELKRVVVTGVGAVTPLGLTATETWQNVLKGMSGATPITRFDASTFKTKFACEVKDFDPLQYFERKDARKMDRYTQFALVATQEALEHSGLDLEKIDKDEVGVVFAAGIGGIATFEQEVANYYLNIEQGPRFNPFFIPKMISDIAAGQISIRYGFRGPNYSTASACASSNHGMINAFNHIRLGDAKIMVSGGTEAAITPAGIAGFNALTALSTRNDDPKGASRPFSKSRDGFVIGEGAGCIILEEYEHALARGANILCELVGSGMSADAYHLTATHPDGLGAVLVMRRALKNSNLKTTDVDLISVHGTSTSVGDIGEVKAIQQVFGDHAYKLNISATKSMTGHLLGAAGAVEGIVAIYSIINNIVPPTINFHEGDEDPEIDYNLNFTFNKAQERNVNVALSNTFGFGGHNACVVFKKFKK
ncbi:MAG: beta-ketoacyl-ACP synthase II [Bacteroidales bacterium]|nr:beta-ketoacyl-ACP synthase II [Bacteroidales bacterium]